MKYVLRHAVLIMAFSLFKKVNKLKVVGVLLFQHCSFGDISVVFSTENPTNLS
jgi:hypothetical protein